MKHGRRTLGTLLLVCCLVQTSSALAAPTSAAVACGPSPGVVATGTPIAIGAIVSRTGVDDFSASTQAAAAYFACVNANGGIHGRPIHYTVIDDRWDPQRAAAAARDLIDQHKVVAMVGSSSFVECPVNAQLYESKDVMSIAGVGVRRECFYSKNYVPVNSGPRVSATVVGMYAIQQLKSKRLVCVLPGIPNAVTQACAGAKADGAECIATKKDLEWGCGGVVEWAKLKGVHAEVQLVDPVTLDAAKTMEAIAAGKPDTVLLNLPFGLMVPMLTAAEVIGLESKLNFVSSAPAYNMQTPRVLSAKWSGRLHAGLEFQPNDRNSPATREWRAVLDQYGVQSVPHDTFSQAGYLAAKLTVDALTGMKGKAITRAEVSRTLRQVSRWRSDMLCEPITVGHGTRHNPNVSGLVMRLKTGGFEATDGACIRSGDPELADLR